MLEKYRATIHGNTIEWDGEAPQGLDKKDSGLKVDITIVSPQPKLKTGTGKRAAAALQKIADRGGIKSIADPVKWQRQIRKDRPLPGRG